MRSALRRPGAATTLLSLLLAGFPAAVFPAEEPATAPPPAAAPAAPSAPREAPRSLTVYFPDEEAVEPAAEPAPAPAPVEPASPWTVAVLGLVLVAAVLAWMRLRAPLCPRCRTKMSVLEPEDAAGKRPHLEVLACQGCDEVMRRRYKLFLTQDRRCPACATVAKVSRLVPIDRPGYLTWGRMRVDDECARCDYRASSFYAAPLLEAPPRQRPRRSQTV